MYPLSLRPRSICFWLPPHVLIIRAQPSIRRTFLHEPSTTKYQSFRNKLYLIGLFANQPNQQPFGFQSAVVWSTSQSNPDIFLYFLLTFPRSYAISLYINRLKYVLRLYFPMNPHDRFSWPIWWSVGLSVWHNFTYCIAAKLPFQLTIQTLATLPWHMHVCVCHGSDGWVNTI